VTIRSSPLQELVSIAREAGARKVYLTSAAPPVRWPNVYGIDIPTRCELVAFDRDVEDIARLLSADWVVFQVGIGYIGNPGCRDPLRPERRCWGMLRCGW
jgi:glutamine phosphoribosylpyrophosphate amidotransferase